MRIHKYTSNLGTFYVLSPSSTKPIQGEAVSKVKWMGWANPGTKNITELGDLAFSSEEEEKPEKKEEPKEKKSYSVMDYLRDLAMKSQEKAE